MHVCISSLLLSVASLCVRVKVGGCGGWLFLRLSEREEDRGAQGRTEMDGDEGRGGIEDNNREQAVPQPNSQPKRTAEKECV